MEKVGRISSGVLCAMILVALGMNAPSMSFGELLLSVPAGEQTTKTNPSAKEIKKEVVAFPAGSTGFRSEESQTEHTADHLLPLHRALSMENQEFVETTDASGGTMINLQGKFQCDLKVSSESTDTPVGGPLSPAIP